MSYPRYLAYKPSGVEWLGDVPEHWEVKSLRRVAQINPTKSEISDLSPSTEVSFVPMEAVQEGGGLILDRSVSLEAAQSGFTYFRDCDVVVAKITPCFENGKLALASGLLNGIALGTTELHVIRAGNDVAARFLFYLALSNSFREQGEAAMYGAGGQKRVPVEFLLGFYLALPPLDEQRAIAAFLDRETAQIDALIAKLEQLISLLQEKRQALISHAVTKGLDPTVPMKDSGVEWLGSVPEHWEVLPIKRAVSLRSGDDITSEDIEEVGEYPVYGGNGLRGYATGYTHEGRYVLIGRQGALCGNVNYAEGKFWASEHAVVATSTRTLETTWLGELLRSMNLNQYSVSAAQPGLAVGLISNLTIPIPALDEQRLISAFLEVETRQIDTLIESVEKEETMLLERRAALITAAVTGSIDVR